MNLLKSRSRLTLLLQLLLLSSSFLQSLHPCHAQGLRGMPPEHTSNWIWQDQLLQEEMELKRKLQEIHHSPLKTLDPRYIPTLIKLETALDSQRKDDERVQVLRQLLKAQKEMHGPERDGLTDEIETLSQLGRAIETIAPSESEAAFEEALALALRDRELEPFDVYFCMIRLASARTRCKHFQEAKQLCFQARDFANRNHLNISYHDEILLETYCKSKSFEEAKRLIEARWKGGLESLQKLAEIQFESGDDRGLLKTYLAFHRLTKEKERGSVWFAEILASRHLYEAAWQQRRELIAKKDLEHYLACAIKEFNAVDKLARLPGLSGTAAKAQRSYLTKWASALALRIRHQELASAKRNRHGK